MEAELFPAVIDVGELAGVGCTTRIWTVFISTLFLLIVGGAIFFSTTIAIAKARGGASEPGFAAISAQRSWKIALAGVLFVATVIIATGAALSRSRTTLTATETSIVENGCWRGAIYEDVYEREKTSIVFKHRTRNRPEDILTFVHKEKRDIDLVIRSVSNFKVLTVIAAAAMKEYAALLRERGDTIPAELQKF